MKKKKKERGKKVFLLQPSTVVAAGKENATDFYFYPSI